MLWSEEQPTSDPKQPSGEGKESVDDLWADAFNEQQSTEKSGASTEGVFKSLEAQDALGSLQDIDLILDIPVKLTVELGRTKMTIKELLRRCRKARWWRWTAWPASRWTS